jgi:hypothetical protein
MYFYNSTIPNNCYTARDFLLSHGWELVVVLLVIIFYSLICKRLNSIPLHFTQKNTPLKGNGNELLRRARVQFVHAQFQARIPRTRADKLGRLSRVPLALTACGLRRKQIMARYRLA